MEFLRYAGVGGLAFVIDFGLLTLAVHLGVNYLTATVIGFLGGLLTAFTLCVLWVWRGTRATTPKDFVVFTVIGVIGLGLTYLGMWAGVGLLGMHYAIVKVLVAAVVLVWNFALRRLFVFFR
ncbi:MAG TPA: GtrA family protein [Rhodocyclaceae bacterium]|nr:GtrA family protein [Rhodocyclaceae bacterium]